MIQVRPAVYRPRRGPPIGDLWPERDRKKVFSMAVDTKHLEVGDQAPDFMLSSTDGSEISLEQFKGKQNVVLYFYPRDDTPGCTKEACSFRDLSPDFAKVGAVILGVSGDDVDSHQKFASKFTLPFPLLADTDHDVSTRYGAYQLKEADGKQFMGIVRTTFLIDKTGKIRKIYPKVSVEGHVEEVLKDISAL
jgi:peroxiredoxin Q/BCP